MSDYRIAFGALAAPLAVQLKIRPRAVTVHQRDADAICRLLVRGLLTESQGRQARLKLLKHIVRINKGITP